ncbi:MAG: LacI family DNA-binding transcriptional regulator [Trueperaceae bacterium]
MPTIRDVAREAGVSEGTVSNVFNQRPHVAERTKARVLDAAERVGYHKNTLAQALRLGKRSVLGLCLRDISNPTFSTIVQGVEAVARERGYQVILGNSDGTPETERDYLVEYLSQQVAGIITAPVLETPRLYETIWSARIPIVFINQRPPGVRGVLVKHDYSGGTRRAAEYLLEQGHTRIGTVFGPPYAAPGMEQQKALHAALASAGVAVSQELEAFARLGIDGAYQAARQLLTLPTPPTAMIGSTLAITLGCIRAISEARCRVEFVGTGDEEWLQIFPELTIVRQHSKALGRAAVTQLMTQIDSPAFEQMNDDIVLPVELLTPEGREVPS